MGRIAMMFVGYVLACIAASLVFTIGTLTDINATDLPSVALWPIVIVGGSAIAAIAMVPSLLLMALAERLAWRSILVYGALGGVLALALGSGLDFAGYLGDPDNPVLRDREVLAASGIAGGFVYWLCAGRKAGSWWK